jgi:hypothetical protein
MAITRRTTQFRTPDKRSLTPDKRSPILDKRSHTPDKLSPIPDKCSPMRPQLITHRTHPIPRPAHLPLGQRTPTPLPGRPPITRSNSTSRRTGVTAMANPLTPQASLPNTSRRPRGLPTAMANPLSPQASQANTSRRPPPSTQATPPPRRHTHRLATTTPSDQHMSLCQ